MLKKASKILMSLDKHKKKRYTQSEVSEQAKRSKITSERILDMNTPHFDLKFYGQWLDMLNKTCEIKPTGIVAVWPHKWEFIGKNPNALNLAHTNFALFVQCRVSPQYAFWAHDCAVFTTDLVNK